MYKRPTVQFFHFRPRMFKLPSRENRSIASKFPTNTLTAKIKDRQVSHDSDKQYQILFSVL
ncbi:unnamed protein product [Acanthoscelides obtectus]|uniref:Uncharacterized protein n=1 Tax=Acanthoscelides obtectus TaxID=200917 RepID=A0A9P0PVK7_ACAOB|nr:unnamed protein product [Acanthoscelides obtectus]CAK1654450.1 hypothetical protein AOBTE_LOCUS18606 [Acanthoscelides obtectus]